MMGDVESLGILPGTPLEQDDTIYSCKGCGDILDEGKAFELAGNRWHIDCFRCNTCNTVLDSDANLLLLGDGSLICNSCTYSCSACGNKIEDLAILTGDQAFCAECFRCRNCKGKIENLRYARTSQGIFCMSCHESLMARRRKKAREAKASSNHHSHHSNHSNSSTPAVLDKSLPALPSNAASDRQAISGTPDMDTPPDSYNATPSESSPRTKIHANKHPSPARRKRENSPAAVNGIHKGNMPPPPSSTVTSNKRHSSMTQSLDNGDDTGYLPISLDPGIPSNGPLPSSLEDSLTKGSITDGLDAPRDDTEKKRSPSVTRQTSLQERKQISSRSSSIDRATPQHASSKLSGSPHIAYQEKRRQASQDILDPARRRKDNVAPSPSTLSSLSPGKGGTCTPTESPLPPHNVEGFKLQEAPRTKKSMASAKNSPTSLASPDFKTPGSGKPAKIDEFGPELHRDPSPARGGQVQHADKLSEPQRNLMDLPKRMGSLPSANQPNALPKSDSLSHSSSQAPRPFTSSTTQARKPSLSSNRAVTDNSVPRLSDGRTVSKPIESPASRSLLDPPSSHHEQNGARSPGPPLGSSAPDSFATPRLPPMPPTPSTDAPNGNGSTSIIPFDMFKGMDAPLSPLTSLPRYSAGGDLLLDDDLSRVARGEDGQDGNSSVLRRVSNAVSKHGRSFSDRGSRSSSGQKWRPPAHGSVDISSPTSIASPGSKEEALVLRNELRRAQQRITELETEKSRIQDQMNGSVEIKQIADDLQVKRTTVAYLDTQRDVVVRELEVMMDHLKRAKDNDRPLDLDSFKSDIVRDCTQSLQELKKSVGSEIEGLVNRRNELTEEITKLIEMKDKGFHEYESISARNAQLHELNNQLVNNIKDQMIKAGQPLNGYPLDVDRTGVNALGIYTNGKDKSDMSVDVRSVASNEVSHLTPDQELDSPAMMSSPKVIDIRRGQPKKFNWKKGGHAVAKNVTKGLNRAFMSNNSQTPPGQLVADGVTYMATTPGMEQPTMNGPRSAMDPSRSGFGIFGQKNSFQKGHQLRAMQNGSNSSGNLSAPDCSVLFGSDLQARCDFEKRTIPVVVSRCIGEVELRGMDVEGIYRKSGGKNQVDAVQDGFSKSLDYDISDPHLDIHTVTSVLKQYFRKLPTPLITYEVYDLLIEAEQVDDVGKRIQGVRDAVKELPKQHHDTLEFLVYHLARIMANESSNLMTSLNLAVVFAPTIMRPVQVEREMTDMQAQRGVVQVLLEANQVIFAT